MEINHKLRQNFDLLNFHINNSPLAFIEWDANFRIKSWSAKAQQIFGYAEEEVKNLNPLALKFLDTEARMQIKWKMDELITGERTSNKLETCVKTKSGKMLSVELYNSALLDEDGKLISAVSFAHDITKRKRAEESIRANEALLSQLFKNSPIGIVRLDENDRIIDINNSFEQLFGYSLAEIEGQSINELIVPEHLREQAKSISSNAHAGKPSQAEVVRIRKDGTEIPVLAAGVPVNIQDYTIAIYGMYVDLTERKRAEEKIKRSLREKEILLAEIHHRVKNNLALISGLLELQIDNSVEEKVKNALRYSQSRIISMAMVHERLYQSDTLSELDCREFVKKLIATIAEAHYNENKSIEVHQSVDCFKLNVTQAIPVGLILNELLVNAFKHAFSDVLNGRVEVVLKRSDDNVCLSVRDDGKGFPDNLDPEVSESLGLTLIHTLTKQLKGRLKMSNKSGSRFEIKFKME